MQIDLIKSKKFPRLFLAHSDDVFQALPGVQMLLPSRQLSPVFDLSYAGIAISSSGLVGILKPGHYFPATLKLEGHKEPVALKLRVVKVTAKLIGFVFDTMATEGRLKLDQVIKDQLVVKNMRVLSSGHLQPALQADVWYHGPFDTNVFIWTKKDGPGIEKIILEYDNLIWIYTSGKVELQKSLSATDEAKGYAAPIFETAGQKVSMGASWMDRLIKTIEQLPDSQGYLKETLQLLKLQRSQ